MYILSSLIRNALNVSSAFEMKVTLMRCGTVLYILLYILCPSYVYNCVGSALDGRSSQSEYSKICAKIMRSTKERNAAVACELISG